MAVKPTVMGGGQPTAVATQPAEMIDVIPAPAQSFPLALPQNFPVQLHPDEEQKVMSALANADIVKMSAREVASLESDVETALHHTLDGFLSRIDQFDNPQIFQLFQRLKEEVDSKDLPALADKIINEEPSGWLKFKLFFMTKKGRQALLDALADKTRDLLKGSTKTLVDFVNQLEDQIKTEARKVESELGNLDRLREAYRDHFRDFAISTAFAQAFLAKSKAQVAALEAQADMNDPTQKQAIDDLKDKLQALESRSLALEGKMTKLPAEQAIVRQLEQSGIATLTEVTTTASGRFADIKLTLITLHTAMGQQRLQKLANQGAVLDSQLQAVRSHVMTNVVTNAANAPGENRLAQAASVKKIVDDTKAMMGIVEKAKETNAAKFAAARQVFADARQELTGIGQQLRPDVPAKKW